MEKIIKKIAVMTSGGDAPGMNAAIRSVIRAASYYKIESLGIYRGYQGLIEGDIVKMDARSVHHIIHKGGTILKTARSDDFRTKEGRKKAYDNLIEHEIDGLVIIGGDGSFTGGMIFNEEYNFPIIGIPGTIDNDIYGTDFTIGYDTALNTVVEVIDKIRDTASSHNRLFFIEVMGRDSGFIALNAGIGAGAEEILIPEEDLAIERLLVSLENSRRSGKTSSIVVVAEGDKTGENVFELAAYVEKHLPQYDVKVSILGHMQRGGSPSCFDRVMASRMGVKAVELLIDGKTNLMVGIRNNKMDTTELERAIKEHHNINSEILRISDIMSV
ncbi:MAG: 6-phosphofructokinase [Flavobacteriaceae bacterium]|nr:6-phosphofructokinase [Flavobacteriaceae bacterium]